MTEPEPKCDDCRFVKNCPLLYFPPCEQLARNDERHYREKAKTEREKVLGLAHDMYGILMCIEKENTEEFMNYFVTKMEEFKLRYESLRGGATDEGGERR